MEQNISITKTPHIVKVLTSLPAKIILVPILAIGLCVIYFFVFLYLALSTLAGYFPEPIEEV